jgi:hypothetical protein
MLITAKEKLTGQIAYLVKIGNFAFAYSLLPGS